MRGQELRYSYMLGFLHTLPAAEISRVHRFYMVDLQAERRLGVVTALCHHHYGQLERPT